MSSFNPSNNQTVGINESDREQLLLDDLRAEISRLADAVERQNELLADIDTDGVTSSYE